MHELFRTLAVHQARFYQTYLASWGTRPDPATLDLVVEALVYDGLWLTKFPLLWAPAYGVARLDGVQKSWGAGPRDAAAAAAAAAEVSDLRPRVDADTLRFVLKLRPQDLEAKVELFFGGRAMNKPLWQYLLGWFEHSAGFRGRLPGPTLLETMFS